MDAQLLDDPKVFPDDQVLARCLGKAKPAWDAFATGIAERFPDASLEWRYYNDGKAWLCKVTRKKKTVCWVSVWDTFFKAAFYFTPKNDNDIAALPIPSDLKDAYRARAGKLKPLVFDLKTTKALGPVFIVAEYKIGLK